MISDSRFWNSVSQFLNTLLQISNEVITYYFQTSTPTAPYKMGRHLTELYTFVFENCTKKPSNEDKMLQVYKTALEKHIIKHMQFLQNVIRDGHHLIKTYNLIWKSYSSYTLLLSKRIFAYLNRYYIPANDLETLNTIGLSIFVNFLVSEDFMKAFIAAYSIQIQKMRKTNIIDHSELLKFTQSMTILNNSKLFPIFREIYFIQAAKFYQEAFQKHCNNQPMAYFNFINNQHYFELFLIKKCICLTNSEEEQLLALFNKQLVVKYTHIFCTHPYGFSYLLRNQKIQSLKLIYEVYKKKQGFTELKKHLYQFILQQGNVKFGRINQQAISQQFIDAFFEFYNQYSKLISEGFNKNTQMQTAFKGAIQKLLIKFDRVTEDLFKLARLNLDQGKFELIENKIIQIFEKLPYKDEFINLYRLSLEKKIISGTFIYLIEKKFISTINEICGSDSISDLDKILEDCISSMPKNLPMISDNFNVKVIALHFWQKKFEDQISLNLSLVQPLASSWMKFEMSYLEIFPKRRLILLPYETKVILKMHIKNKEMTLKCNLIQACIILFIANNQSQKLREQNVINGLTLEKTFLHRFIDEFPNLILVDGNNYFHFNWSFETLDNFADLDSKIEEEKKVTRHIKQDRDILIQCAIVKVVKKAKQMQFQDLVLQVIHEIKLFKPHPSSIKAALEGLKKKQIVDQDQNGKIIYKT